MSEEYFIFGFLGAVGVSALTIIVAVWIRPGKGTPGWLMAGSTVPVLIAVACLAWMALGRFHGQSWSRDTLGAAVFGLLTVAAILFTSGFLWDRMRRSDEEG